MSKFAPMLINCSECGKQISDNAYACPNCGNPVLKKNSNVDVPRNSNSASRVKPSGFIASAVGIIIFLCAGLIGQGSKGSHYVYRTPPEQTALIGLRFLGLVVTGSGLLYSLKGMKLKDIPDVNKSNMISGTDLINPNRFRIKENERITNLIGKLLIPVVLFIAIISLI